MLMEAAISTIHQVAIERNSIERSAKAAVQSAAATYHSETELYPTAFAALLTTSKIQERSIDELTEKLKELLPDDIRTPDLQFVHRDAYMGDPLRSTLEEAPPTQARRGQMEAKLSITASHRAMLVLKAGINNRPLERARLAMYTPLPKFSAYTRSLSGEGYRISLFDKDGRFISQSGGTDRLESSIVRKIISADALNGKVVHKNGIGEDVITLWQDVHGEGSGEYLALTMTEASFFSDVTEFLALLLLGKSMPLFCALGCALLLFRILSRSQRELMSAASSVGNGRRIDPITTPLQEVNAIGGVLVDASKRLERSSHALSMANEHLERRIEERTREIHRKTLLLEATLNSVDQGIVYLDDEANVVLANRRATEILRSQGIEHGDVNQLREFAAGTIVEDQNDPPLHLLAPNSGIHQMRTFERTFPDGTVIEVHNTELVDGTIVCSMSDVTDRVRQAEELESARKTAEDANRAKDDFLANMSHELRTPLNAVLGYADLLLLDYTIGEISRQRIRSLRGAGWNLLTLVNDVLDYSQVTLGKITINKAEFSIHELVSDVLSIVQPSASERSISLDVEIDADIPNYTIGDQNRIRQILINLLSNAVKFTDVGFVRLEVRLETADSNGCLTVTFSVEDSGIGIPIDQHDAVFDRFHQASRRSNTVHQGSGLGLAICRELAELMGGKIWFQSSPYGGTIFYVTLVLHLPLVGSDHTGESTGECKWPPRILVADDMELGRDVMAQLLQTVGAEVDCVQNGDQALFAALNGSYDMIILDLNMPTMGGCEAARLIRSNLRTAKIPIIACSASAPDVEEGREFDQFLAKPVSLAAIKVLLSQHIGHFERHSCPFKGERSRFERQNGVGELAELIGSDRAKRGLSELLSQVDDLLHLDLTDIQNAERIGAIAHTAITSSGLFGFHEAAKLFRNIESDLPEGQSDLQSARNIVAELRKFRRKLARIEAGLT